LVILSARSQRRSTVFAPVIFRQNFSETSFILSRRADTQRIDGVNIRTPRGFLRGIQRLLETARGKASKDQEAPTSKHAAITAER
jgi:hypothetical protein